MIGPLTRIEPDTTVMNFRLEGSSAAAAETLEAMPTEGRLPKAAPELKPAAPRPGSGISSGDGRRDPAEPMASGDVSRLLSLLADRTRLKILRILAGGERPVVALTSELRLPQPTVSHHLAWLRTMDLVSPRRQGKHIYYALGPAVEFDEAGTMTFRATDAIVTVSGSRAD